MDSRRFLYAVMLSVAVFFVFQFLLPAPKQKPVTGGRADSAAVADSVRAHAASTTASAAAGTTATPAPTQTAPAAQSSVAATPSAPAVAIVPAETTVVAARTDSGATFKMTNVGAAPASVVMNAYENRVGHGKVDVASGGRPILAYQLVENGGRAVDLSTVPFQESRSGNVVTYTTTVNGSTVALRYSIVADSFVSHVTGNVSGAGNGTYLVVTMPQTFAATEPDTAADRNALSYAYLARHEAPRAVSFHSLDPGEKQLVEGPITWIAVKSKYFVVGLLAPKNAPGFTEATLVGGPRTTKVATHMNGTVVVPVKNGAFSFDLYAGPQAYERLAAQGRDFDQVNPYGWAFLRSIMQPIAASVIRTVLWMHRRLGLSYGLVLIALGLIIRLLMWPLYQSSMRTSLKMQVLQPELQAVQDRYKDDPEKQRTEVMKVYQEHGMNPLSPLLGCLPSLLPMPILFALYFVFGNTIELRGVPFLWLSDLSAKDPYYILPLIMGASMYLISWIGLRTSPPNPQAKMMSYVMPAMFTFFFYRAAAGLNLYYATQNLATLPQQWHLAHSRGQIQAAKGGAKTAPVKGAVTTKKAAKG